MSAERDERRRLAEHATERLTSSIDVLLGDRLVLAEGEKADYFSDGVVVDAFWLTERCARRLAHPPQDFLESTATARRRLGLFVLRELAARPWSPGTPSSDGLADAVQRVIEEQLDWPNNLRMWVGDLDRAGTAALVAAVTTWCDGALRLVGRDPRIVWADPARAPAWNVPGRVVQLRATLDAVMGGVVSGERLLSISDAAPRPSDRLRAGYLALVRSLGTRHAPVRITTGAPSTGTRTAVVVDEALLDLTVDRVLEVVQVRADPDGAPAAPGRDCTWCHLLEDCAEGRTHLGADPSTDPTVRAHDDQESGGPR